MRRPRTVFGRVWVVVGENHYKVEMRPDAVYVRQRHHRRWSRVPFKDLINLTKPQLELADWIQRGVEA